MTETTRSPDDLRRMFGANLRRLANRYPSVSEVCRRLGINRTQFNRYLSGESFPRPDVLDRICRFFAVDARILLKPLDDIEPAVDHPASETLDRFLAAGPDLRFAPGFYHAIETGADTDPRTRHRLLHVRHIGHCALLRGYEPRSVLPGATAPQRELQGIVAHNGTQVCVLMSRRCAQDRRLMVLSQQPSEGSLHWAGYMLRLSDHTVSGPNVRQLDLHHLAYDLAAALRLRRHAPHAPTAR